MSIFNWRTKASNRKAMDDDVVHRVENTKRMAFGENNVVKSEFTNGEGFNWNCNVKGEYLNSNVSRNDMSTDFVLENPEYLGEGVKVKLHIDADGITSQTLENDNRMLACMMNYLGCQAYGANNQMLGISFDGNLNPILSAVDSNGSVTFTIDDLRSLYNLIHSNS